MATKEKESPTEVLYSADWLELKRRGRYEFISRKRCSGVVIIVPVTDSGEMILVEQFRAAVGKKVLELPAGLVGDEPAFKGESFEVAAKRELLEETGFEAQRISFLMSGPVSSGAMSEIINFYRADGLIERHAGGGDEHEDITVHRVPVTDIHAFIEDFNVNHGLVDPKVYIGLYFGSDAQRFQR